MRTKHFRQIEELEDALWNALLTKIDLSIEEHGDARILLSGGNTPKALYQRIASSNIDWSNILIGLVDDRNVDLSSEYSNERMIRETFKSTGENGPKILGLVNGKSNLDDIKELYAPFYERIDYAILGMGMDGHTASLFPDDPPSEASLRNSEKDIIFTNAPSFPNERISCSRGLLISSEIIGLMIIGEQKLEVLDNSDKQNLPISYFTNACQQLTTYFCKS